MNKKLATLFFLLLFSTSNAVAADYKIDVDHSTVGFKVKHLAISKVPGKFTGFAGTFSFDPTKVEASKAEVTIQVSSITTENKKRDDHLRSPDFFDASKFAEMKFRSTGVSNVSGPAFDVIGELTIRGVSKPVVLHVTFDGAAKDPWGMERAAFTAQTKINRKDFGLTWSKVLETGALVVGDDVEIEIAIEGIQQAAKN